MDKIEGGCLCGDIRYEANSEILMAYRCHCKDCQRLSGTGHLSIFVIPKALCNISGTLKYFNKVSDSGSAIKVGFCPNCGSNILANPDGAPDITALGAGSLDNAELFQPTIEIFTKSAPTWDHIDSKATQFDGMFPQD